MRETASFGGRLTKMDPLLLPYYISMYVLEQYLINGSSEGWTNATQLRDIVSLLRGPNL